MKRQNKKGFTIVELVIVIAVIAILAAVLIPTFSSVIKKAKISADTQVVRNLNTALATDSIVNGKPETMSEALEIAAEAGYDVAKINASAAGNAIVWDSVNNVFCYINDGNKQYIPNTQTQNAYNYQLWVISKTVSTTYSTYYNGNNVDTLAAVDGLGLDTGKATVGLVTYGTENESYSSTNSVVIRTNGGDLEVNAPDASVDYFSDGGSVNIIAIKDQSFHAYGKIDYVEIHAGRFEAKSTAEVKVVAAAQGAVVEAVKEESIKIKYVEVEDFTGIEQGATLFAGGKGTADVPYLIETAEQFKNINEVYEKGYNYFEVLEGVSEIDAKDLGRINLNGSFNGKGATFKNANGYIFGTVGTCENAADELPVVVENFNVIFDGGFGVVRNCGAKTLTYSNVNVLGYMVQDWCAGVFLRYGTANVSDAGFDYTLNFVNCSSVAEIYSSANAFSAILVGHAYSTNGKATINVDSATDSQINATKLYYTGTAKEPFGYKYYGMNDGATEVFVDGVKTTENKITGENIVKIDSNKNPVKADGGYVLDTEADTTKVVVTLIFQYTLYTDNTYTQAIAGQSGVGGALKTELVFDVVGGEEIEVLGKIESIVVVTGSDKFDYTLEDGVLTVYVLNENSNLDGWVTLIAEQYTAGTNIAKYKGQLRVAQRSAKNNPEATWIVK